MNIARKAITSMKGLYTQTAVLLTKGKIDLDDVAARLSEFGEITKTETQSDWAFGATTLRVPLNPEENSYVLVDYVPKTWPDSMGDPKDDPIVFGAWSMGAFGPFAYPGGLERAQQQCWTWEDGAEVSAGHDGFIRLRSSYSVGVGDDDPVLPEEYDAVFELASVTEMADNIIGMPNILCYFNPNGETLYSPEEFAETLEYNEENQMPSLDLWTNVRIYDLSEHAAGWSLQDTVGLAQLDIPDQEAVFMKKRYDPEEVAQFLRSVSMYILENGMVIADGDTIDGVGGIPWQGFLHNEGLASPPRETLRWFPVDKSIRPTALTEKKTE